MSDATKLDAAALAALAKARGIVIPAAQLQPALNGANWLRDCVAQLKQAGCK